MKRAYNPADRKNHAAKTTEGSPRPKNPFQHSRHATPCPCGGRGRKRLLFVDLLAHESSMNLAPSKIAVIGAPRQLARGRQASLPNFCRKSPANELFIRGGQSGRCSWFLPARNGENVTKAD